MQVESFLPDDSLLMKFHVGDYAVCPGHGVAQVRSIDRKNIGDEEKFFYILRVISNGMTVMVPTDSTTGIRPLAEEEEIQKIYSILQDHHIVLDNTTWNRRYRDYMSKIKTGSLTEIAEVLRSLFLLKVKKNLSFGEKKMLDQCKELLGQEISISAGQSKETVFHHIDSLFD